MDSHLDKNPWLWIAAFIILSVAFQSETVASPAPTGTDLSLKTRLVETYGKLPLSFELNQGQSGDQVRFLSRGPGYSVFLTPTEAVLSLQASEANEQGPSPQSAEQPVSARALPPAGEPQTPSLASQGTIAGRATSVQKTQPRSVLRMQLVGANPKPQTSGVDALPGKVNYFRGNDPKRWRTSVPTYAKVKYDNVYPGIDLVYYGNQRQLEHDFVVAPGADPKTIRLAFAGAERLAIDVQGDLVLTIAGGDVHLRKPQVYQDINGQQREIEGRYVLCPTKSPANSQVGFQVAAYDKTKSLIIDPVLLYSTHLGGSSVDRGEGIAVDGAGNAYVTGETFSTNFPVANPLQGAFAGGLNADAFVAKLNSDGSAFVYSTYLGGSGADAGSGIAVDSVGNVYVTGVTRSTDFPVVNPLQGALAGGGDAAFVAKLNSDGSALVYSTYLGGSANELGFSIAIDSGGNAYVTGVTESTNFPTANPLQGAFGGGFGDAFVAKLNPAGSALVYSTYLGGANVDRGSGIAVDSVGNAYVTGATSSPDFPVANPLQGALGGSGDVFVAKLNPAGSAFVYSTYLGGANRDSGSGIAVDSAGNAYVTGNTTSTNFPVANPLQGALAGSGDVFVAKLNPAGSAFVYSTYLGGSGPDEGFSIAVDSVANAYVTGATRSTDFPIANPLQDALANFGDVFVAKLNPAGSALLYSTYLGGSDLGSERDEGFSIAVDNGGNAYVTGETSSADFPIANPLQDAFVGTDAFVAKVSDTAPPPPQPVLSVTPISLDFGTVTVDAFSDLTLTVTNSGTGTLTGTASTSAPFSTVSGGSFSLGAGVSQTVVVRFSPTAQGVFEKILDVTSNAGNAPPSLTGIGVVPSNKQPVIKGSPKSAAPGDKITLFGRNFGPTQGQLTVGGQTVAPSSWFDTFIEFIVPDLSPDVYNVIVTTSGGQAITALEILPPAPKIVDIRPKSGAPGSTVIIDGHNFGVQQGTSVVTAGSLVSEVAFWGDKRIGIKIPSVLGFGIHRLEMTTPSGVAADSFRIRNLVLVPEYGDCDVLFINVCPAIVPSITGQKQAGTVVDIAIENNQARWYEVTVTPIGASIPSNATFILGPQGIRKIGNVSVMQGARISFVAVGTSVNAMLMLETDLLFRFATGRHFPQDAAEAAVTGIKLAAPLAAFFDDLRAALANKDITAALRQLWKLPSLASDPIVRDVLRNSLKLTAQQVAKIDDISQVIRLTSLIGETLVILNSPRFGTAALVAR